MIAGFNERGKQLASRNVELDLYGARCHEKAGKYYKEMAHEIQDEKKHAKTMAELASKSCDARISPEDAPTGGTSPAGSLPAITEAMMEYLKKYEPEAFCKPCCPCSGGPCHLMEHTAIEKFYRQVLVDNIRKGNTIMSILEPLCDFLGADGLNAGVKEYKDKYKPTEEGLLSRAHDEDDGLDQDMCVTLSPETPN